MTEKNEKPTALKIRPLPFALICLVIPSALSLLPHDFLIFELASHFKAQYFCLSVMFLFIATLRKKRNMIICFALLSLLNGIYVLPWYLNSKQVSPAATLDAPAITLKILHANVLTSNQEKNKLLALIAAQQPDVISIQELDTAWARALTPIEQSYPHHVIITRADNFGIALYSKHPFVTSKHINEGQFSVPIICVTLQWQSQTLEIITTHPVPPISSEYFKARNAQLNFIAKYCQQAKTPVVLIGDLNATMWSQHFKDFISISKLKNARQGHGILPTWPSTLPLIPIDHCLVSPSISVKNMQRCNSIGSDHLPIMTTIAF